MKSQILKMLTSFGKCIGILGAERGCLWDDRIWNIVDPWQIFVNWINKCINSISYKMAVSKVYKVNNHFTLIKTKLP